MPLSLWLVPYEGNPFRKTVQELISDTVPSYFLPPDKIHPFPPHVTLVSDFDDKTLDGKDPQEWLDNIQLPAFKNEYNEVLLYLDTLEADDDFYRKMSIALKDDDNLKKLVAACRKQTHGEDESKAQAWAEKDYRPHLSLLYGDVPTKDVKGKVALIEMKLGFAFGDLFACCGGTLCMGGKLLLVDTSSSVDQWKTMATRDTPWAMWRATKNLI